MATPAAAPAQGSAPSAPPAGASATVAAEELEQIVAPIAPYPNPLLAQVMMASTYPLEVVQAARWLRENPNLKDAQRDETLKKQTWDDSVKSLVYARKISSTTGTRDGLYWPTKLDEEVSPLGLRLAEAQRQGYAAVKDAAGKPLPYHGYYYRLLTAQGPDAPGGAYDYLVRGHMIGGFALVAHPAQWGASGIMTFIVNHDGVVYQKDLGPKTTAVAEAMKRFNPDATRQRVSG